MRRASPIICVEGPCAVGKTTLAAALARSAGVSMIEEVSGPPPIGVPQELWFVGKHVETWRHAARLAARDPLVVLDGDPFKGLWYDWVFAPDPRTAVAKAAELYMVELHHGALGVPDLYVALNATEEQLRKRRMGDVTRSRRSFEKHLRLVRPLQRYFTELATIVPAHVLRLETADRDPLLSKVLEAIPRLPETPPSGSTILNHMAAWLNREQVNSDCV